MIVEKENDDMVTTVFIFKNHYGYSFGFKKITLNSKPVRCVCYANLNKWVTTTAKSEIYYSKKVQQENND